MATRQIVNPACFNTAATLPYSLRLKDFEVAMQDVYDFFYDVNDFLQSKSLPRLDDTLRAANMSGMISDMLTASVAKHSRALCQNLYHNGHPDLIVQGHYPNDAVKAGTDGIEIKSTRKKGGQVDTHGARDQWMCVFVYQVDTTTQPAINRAPTRFTEVYLSKVLTTDFRKNNRGPLGTRTATVGGDALARFRSNWIYLETP